MIRLERHIEILLLNNDCVIVPEFGGFMAYHVNAKYNDDEGLFFPPLRAIGFNPQLKMNDSLLVQSYVEAYDISYPEALKRIENEVDELKSHLNNKGIYELNNIGVISKNEENNYIFNPCEAGILTPCLYGLNSIEFVKRNNVSQIAVKSNSVSLINSDNSTKTEDSKLINSENKDTIISIDKFEHEASYNNDNQNISPKVVSIRLSVLRNIAAACIIIIAVMLIPLPLDNGKNAMISRSNMDTRMLYMIMPKDVQVGMDSTSIEKLNRKIIAKHTQKSIISETKTIKQPAKNSLKQHIHNYYSIVLASRVTKSNAATYVKQLQKDGLSKAAVLQRKVGAKVIYGQFETENTAYNELNKLRAKGNFADAWVMFVKNN